MKNQTTIKADYHFHPNLPADEKKAARKISAIYKKFRELEISAIIITEHVYKNSERAYHLMKKYEPKEIKIFPGMEYVTKENIDIIIFSEDEKIYQYKELFPFKLSYEEVLEFISKNKNIFSFVTHPFTLGRTSILDKKGLDFTKKAIDKLGAVEAYYGVFSQLKIVLNLPFLKKIFSKKLERIGNNENLPAQLYSSKIKFLAAGSDAHYVWEIGNYAEISCNGDKIFKAIVENKILKIGGKREVNFFQSLSGLSVVFEEWLQKKLFKIWNYH